MGFLFFKRKKKQEAVEIVNATEKNINPAAEITKEKAKSECEAKAKQASTLEEKTIIQKAKSNRFVSKCVMNDFMHYRNVISKTYVLPQNRVEEAFKDFYKGVIEANRKPEQLPFFLIGKNEDGTISLRIWISVREVNPEVPKGYHFDSYFSIDNMACVCVSDKIEENIADAYVVLSDYLINSSFDPATPMFHILGGDNTKKYMFIKAGCVRNN